jgi:hypothetical protein
MLDWLLTILLVCIFTLYLRGVIIKTAIRITNMADLTQRKAEIILHEGRANGRPLTDKQRRFMGARASGAPARRKGRKATR